MGKPLIGMHWRGDTTHPQDFIDALYEEIFDHHPEDQEVDVFVLVESPVARDKNGQAASDGYVVLDYFVSRVGRDLLLTDTEDDLINFKNAVDRVYAAYVERGDPVGPVDDGWTGKPLGAIFVHKHPPNFPEPGRKDFETGRILQAADYAMDIAEFRMIGLMAVVNRDASTPMRVGGRQPEPAHDHEIDLMVMTRGSQGLLDHGLNPKPEELESTEPLTVEIMTAARERSEEWQQHINDARAVGLAIREARRNGGSTADLDAFADEAREKGKALADFMIEIAPLAAAEARRIIEMGSNPLLNLRDAIEQLAKDLGMDLELAPMAGEPLDFEVPTIEFNEDAPLELPQGEKPKPSSIFDVPAIDDIPDTDWKN